MARITGPKYTKEPPSYLAFVLGLVGVIILILLGGGHNSVALGAALILPGLALLIRPPSVSLGKWMDIGILGFLASLLMAFLPLFYWKTPSWRNAAVDAFRIDLPSILSVQPMISFEALLLAVAGFAWLYAASSWNINHSGRSRFYLWVSAVIAGLALITIWGNLNHIRYPGAEESTAFSFFPNRNQTSNILAIGGVVAFGYAMEGLRERRLLNLSGFLATALCLVALILGISRTGVFLYFSGILVWFVFRLRQPSNSLFLKLGLPILLLIFSVFISSHHRAIERVSEFMAPPSEWKEEYRVLLYGDTLRMIADAPLTGAGLGNYSAIFPQYRNDSRNHQRVVHPESDVLWLASESGIIAVLFLGMIVFVYFNRCRTSGVGRNGAFRIIALTAFILFVLHALVDVPGHRPGTAYFAILFAALALPRADALRPTFKPQVWRLIGSTLLLVGALWVGSGLFGLPLHSKSIISIGQDRIKTSIAIGDYKRAELAASALIDLQPMAWKAYFQRAQILLSMTGNPTDVASDFRRARFVEPTLGVVSYEEGKVWLPHDASRTVSAWRETLFRDLEDKDDIYGEMLQAGRKKPELMDRIIELSMLAPNYRTRLLLSLKDDSLMQELGRDLKSDPALSKFSRKERSDLLERWITEGDLDSAAVYLGNYSDTVNRPWFMQSLLFKENARFKEAVEIVREAIPVLEIPTVEMDEKAFIHLKRRYTFGSKDLMEGTALLRAYLDRDDFAKAFQVSTSLLEVSNPPDYVYYWQAELLYRMGDESGSWYAFETYLKHTRSE
jgi:O-antigen ligase